MDRKEMQNARLYLLTALLVLALIAYFFVLYDVQITPSCLTGRCFIMLGRTASQLLPLSCMY